MKIGIDISQMAYEKTGVANYLRNLVDNLLKIDRQNEYILFFSSLRRKFLISNFEFLNPSTSSGSRAESRDKSQIPNPNFQIKTFKLPPTFLDLLWNKFHICPIEWFLGDIDLFITSDWVEPPAIKAKKATILYDLIIYKYPQEMATKIIEVQKRKLDWVKKESEMVMCISESTKKDAMEILGIEEKRLKVIYPGGKC